MTKVEDSIRSWFENSLDFSEKELIRDLVNIFDYKKEKAVEVYRAWRKEYVSPDYKTIESQMSDEEIATLRMLDEGYEKYLRRTAWWF